MSKTGLTWALERKGWTFGRVFRFWDTNYYRTHADGAGNPSGFMSVRSEVTCALTRPEDFVDVPADALERDRKVSGTSDAQQAGRFIAHCASPACVRPSHQLSSWRADAQEHRSDGR
jgi:hypothetical protein